MSLTIKSELSGIFECLFEYRHAILHCTSSLHDTRRLNDPSTQLSTGKGTAYAAFASPLSVITSKSQLNPNNNNGSNLLFHSIPCCCLGTTTSCSIICHLFRFVRVCWTSSTALNHWKPLATSSVERVAIITTNL